MGDASKGSRSSGSRITVHHSSFFFPFPIEQIPNSFFSFTYMIYNIWFLNIFCVFLQQDVANHSDVQNLYSRLISHQLCQKSVFHLNNISKSLRHYEILSCKVLFPIKEFRFNGKIMFQQENSFSKNLTSSVEVVNNRGTAKLFLPGQHAQQHQSVS